MSGPAASSAPAGGPPAEPGARPEGTTRTQASAYAKKAVGEEGSRCCNTMHAVARMMSNGDLARQLHMIALATEPWAASHGQCASEMRGPAENLKFYADWANWSATACIALIGVDQYLFCIGCCKLASPGSPSIAHVLKVPGCVRAKVCNRMYASSSYTHHVKQIQLCSINYQVSDGAADRGGQDWL